MILVTGARGVVGQPLCQKLGEKSKEFISVSRQADSSSGINWDLHQALNEAQRERVTACDTLIHCAPIWLLSPHIKTLAELGVRRFVVFSSTSVISKQDSLDPQERALVQQLKSAEQELQQISEQGLIDLTIFRPSMIYGYGLDQNVSHIANRVKRWPLIPLTAPAKGLRQPVHADDLVEAAYRVLTEQSTFGKTYNLAGAESLSYRAMVERIAASLGKPARVLLLPVWLIRAGLKLAALGSGFNYTGAMADRMNQDLVYDYQQATLDFGFHPKAFLTEPDKDLPK